MAVTIKELAKLAGVSTATVSHVINHTRYVSPDLVEQVEKAVRESGYAVKNSSAPDGIKLGKHSEIAFVIPNLNGTIYSALSNKLSRILAEEEYSLSIYLTEDDFQKEKSILSGLLSNKRIAGIILVPVSEVESDYTKLMTHALPFVCLERTLRSDKVQSVLSDNVQAIYRGTQHLIKSGHENIALLLEKKRLSTVQERLAGYKKALEEYCIPYREQLVMEIDLYQSGNVKDVMAMYKSHMPTAFIGGGNTLTLTLLEAIRELGLECPNDVSIVGFGDDDWCRLVQPAITTLKQNTDDLARIAANQLLKNINGEHALPLESRVPVTLTVRESTQIIARGPFGEKAIEPSQMSLSDDEIERLKTGDFKVALSFHYGGDEWTNQHEKAIKDTFAKFGVKIISVSDAHLDPELQNTQLEGIMMQKPDALISVPSDEEKNAQKFKEVSKQTKLILINNMLSGFDRNDYASWISVNERENGQNAAKVLVDYFEGKNNVQIGMITHGKPFFATHQRDFFAEQTLLDAPNIEIVSKQNFYDIENAYEVCSKMVQEYPKIQGMYISWERPALEAIHALEKLSREDIVIATTDLDEEIASYMAKGKMVIGISSQRPYEQGVAVAIATAKALLYDNSEYKCIGVQPYMVLPRNLARAWRDLIRTPEPEFIKHRNSHIASPSR